MINIFYHLSYKDLNAGDIIEPGNWGNMIQQIGQNHISFLREKWLEDVRLAYYPDKPSRLKSAYVWVSLEACLFWKKFKDPNAIVYEVEFINPELPFHIGDHNAVEPPPWLANFEENAHQYWNSTGKRTIKDYEHIDFSERFSNSSLLIKRKLSLK